MSGPLLAAVVGPTGAWRSQLIVTYRNI